MSEEDALQEEAVRGHSHLALALDLVGHLALKHVLALEMLAAEAA